MTVVMAVVPRRVSAGPDDSCRSSKTRFLIPPLIARRYSVHTDSALFVIRRQRQRERPTSVRSLLATHRGVSCPSDMHTLECELSPAAPYCIQEFLA